MFLNETEFYTAPMDNEYLYHSFTHVIPSCIIYLILLRLLISVLILIDKFKTCNKYLHRFKNR